MTDAVMALRQEIARSYAHSEALGQDTLELRKQLIGLRRDLTRSRDDNQKFKKQIQTLERELKEVRGEPITSPEALAPPPPPPAVPAPPAAAPLAPRAAAPAAPPQPDDADGAPPEAPAEQ